jgi:HAD superfamily phosphoserine phosphatase-like hydrolase
MTSRVYDFDGTIYDGDSTLNFLLFRIKKNPTMVLKIPKLVLDFLKYFLKLITKDEFKSNLFKMLASSKNLEADLKTFWEENLHKIKDFYKSNKASSDIIVSASPNFLLKPLEPHLKIESIIASEFDLTTMRLMGPNCFGEEKIKALLNVYPDIVVSEFYSDSISDEPLAKLAKKAYFVKGKEILPWESLENENNKILKQLKSIDFLRFVFSGGVGTLFNFVSSVIISYWIDPVLTYLISYSLSLLVTYLLTSKLVFSEKISMSRLFKFILAYIPNFIILFTFVAIFIRYLNINRIVVYALAGLLGLPLTFILVKLFTFNKKGELNG